MSERLKNIPLRRILLWRPQEGEIEKGAQHSGTFV